MPFEATVLELGGQRRVPHAVEIVAHGPYPPRVDAVDTTGPVGAVGDEAGSLEDLEVLRHRRPADREHVGQLLYRAGRLDEQFEDGATGRVAKGVKRSLTCGAVGRPAG